VTILLARMAGIMREDHTVQHDEFVVKGEISRTAATGNVDLLDEQDTTRRIPIPSSDPNDPLNFSKRWRVGIIKTCCFYSIVSPALVGRLGSILPAFFALHGWRRSGGVLPWLEGRKSKVVEMEVDGD
jgi:hypothetical protein